MPPWPELPSDWTVMMPSFARLPATSATSAPAPTTRHHCSTRCCEKCTCCVLMVSKCTILCACPGTVLQLAAPCTLDQAGMSQRTQATLRILRAAANVHDHHVGAIRISLCGCQSAKANDMSNASENLHMLLDGQVGTLTRPWVSASSVANATACLNATQSTRYSCAPSPWRQSSGRPRWI
jgi:hypothetical protein